MTVLVLSKSKKKTCISLIMRVGAGKKNISSDGFDQYWHLIKTTRVSRNHTFAIVLCETNTANVILEPSECTADAQR